MNKVQECYKIQFEEGVSMGYKTQSFINIIQKIISKTPLNE